MGLVRKCSSRADLGPKGAGGVPRYVEDARREKAVRMLCFRAKTAASGDLSGLEAAQVA